MTSFLAIGPGPGPLAALVEEIWFCEIGDAHGEESLLPTGRSEIVFGLDTSCPHALVHGPLGSRTVVDAGVQRRAVGVSFRSGGLACVVPGPAERGVDETFEVGDVFGVAGTHLHEELASLEDPQRAMSRLAGFLTQRVDDLEHPADPAVVRAVAMLERGWSVGETVAHVGLDRRVLSVRFRAEVGFGLKHFARLRRFERAVAATRSRDAPSLASVAVSEGYADQAHMTREFRQFASLTPSALHRNAGGSPSHLVA